MGGTTRNVFIDVLQHDCKIVLGLGNHRLVLNGPASQGMSRQVLPPTSTAVPKDAAEPAISL